MGYFDGITTKIAHGGKAGHENIVDIPGDTGASKRRCCGGKKFTEVEAGRTKKVGVNWETISILTVSQYRSFTLWFGGLVRQTRISLGVSQVSSMRQRERAS
jgi:hypothetical protein